MATRKKVAKAKHVSRKVREMRQSWIVGTSLDAVHAICYGAVTVWPSNRTRGYCEPKL